MVLTLLLLAPLGAAIASSSGYQDWWLTGRGWGILFDSFTFSLFAGVVATVGGYAVGRAGIGWSALACVPLAIPSSLLGSAWIVALGRTGPLGDWVTVFDWPVAASAVGLRYLGVAAIIFATQRTGPGPAAQVFQVRRAWWWLHIKPLLVPATAALAVSSLLISTDHIMPSMFLIHTYGTQVLIQYNALQDLPGAAALAIPMLLPAVVAIALVVATLRPWTQPQASIPPHGSFGFALPVVLFAIGIPVCAIVWRMGSPVALTGAMSEMRPEIIRTSLLTAAGAPICAVIGWLLAESWLNAWRRGRWSLVPLILLNLSAPPSLLALGLIDLSDRGPLRFLRDGDSPLIAAYAVRFVPMVVLVMFMVGLRRPTLPDTVARLFHIPVGRRLWRIHWPTRRAELGAVLILCGLLIATELEASLLLVPAGTATVGVRLYTLIHTAPDAQVSASALAVLILLVPWVVCLGFMVRRRRA